MSENYLIHWAKGKEAKNHKYTAREWVNGKWQYVYSALGGRARMVYQQKSKEAAEYARGYEDHQKLSREYNHYKNAADRYSTQYNNARRDQNYYTVKGAAYGAAVSNSRYGRESERQADMNVARESNQKAKEAQTVANQNKPYISPYRKRQQMLTEQYARSSAKYSNFNTKLNNKIAESQAAGEAWRKTPLYKLETAINTGKKFYNMIFRKGNK